MTLEIALALVFVVILIVLSAAALVVLRGLMAIVAQTHAENAQAQLPLPPVPQGDALPPTPVPQWFATPPQPLRERVDDDDSQPTLLPFATPLPPMPDPLRRVDYSEDEDDVPTTLYQTEEDAELGLLADADD